MRMFDSIKELLADPGALVCVLMDEVESLTAARQSSLAGSEPSDAIRVVNALLTQLDQIRRLFFEVIHWVEFRYKNVIILTTSNITGAVDLAFVDRSDACVSTASSHVIVLTSSSTLVFRVKKVCMFQTIVNTPRTLSHPAVVPL
jgi:hypothetical protein